MQLTLDQALAQAVAAHRGGRHAEAEQLYRAVLQAHAGHPDANHNLGVLLLTGGHIEPAIANLKRALAANETNGQYWLSLVEALVKAQRLDEAAQVLAAGRQRGLAGERVEQLSRQLGERPTQASAAVALDEPLAMRESGRLADAEAWLRASLGTHASDAEALALLAHVLLLQKKDPDAQATLARAAAIAPGSPAVLRNMARLHLRSGKPADALASARAALAGSPEDEETWLLMASALAANNNAPEALQWIDRALSKRPRYAEAFANRANLRMRAKDVAGAAADAEEAVAIKPHLTAAWVLLANLRQQKGDLAGAIDCLTKAAEQEPLDAAHLVNLGEFQRQARRSDEAIATLQRATSLAPGNFNAWVNYGTALQDAGRNDEAMKAYEAALRINPKSFAMSNNLGLLARDAMDWDRARQYFSQAVALDPTSAGAHVCLGDALYQLKLFDESEVECRRAIEIAPDSPAAHSALARTLIDMGRSQESNAHLSKVLALNPRLWTAHATILYNMAYTGCAPPDEYLASARAWEAIVLPAGGPAPVRFANTSRSDRRLRVGYVSGDFRQHPVSAFIEPILRSHDKDRFDVVAYTTNALSDDTTERLRALVGQWRSLANLTVEKACRQIIDDGIDVLIDLAGHTLFSRPDVFAHRAAPVQAHYLGFFASTGITAMDYWIGDPTILPEHETASFSESLWRLPRVWVCYEGRDDAPIPAWQPRDDRVRFGSFNHLNKITPDTIALWARVLHATPGSSLILKTAELEAEANRARIAAKFHEHGIEAARLALRGRTPGWAEHMSLYDEVDIALDPVGGVGGGTTTCEALWMGAPLVTLAGDRMAARMTASMLEAIGQPGWIAQSESGYVAKAAQLARELASMRAPRAEQRARMRASALCDAAGLTRALEQAYGEMFDRWQERAPC